MFFFVKKKPAYEMRISDWSSDVCSSDLPREAHGTISLQDGHSQSAVLKAMGAEAVVFAASVTTRLDGTLQAEDGFALSDSLRYALTLQAAETLLMAATAARSAEIALTAQDR